MSNISTGRNDPCPCGSGKKFKKCCLGKEMQSLLEDFRARQGCETEAEDPKPAKD